jgi:hypothetical protein
MKNNESKKVWGHGSSGREPPGKREVLSSKSGEWGMGSGGERSLGMGVFSLLLTHLEFVFTWRFTFSFKSLPSAFVRPDRQKHLHRSGCKRVAYTRVSLNLACHLKGSPLGDIWIKSAQHQQQYHLWVEGQYCVYVLAWLEREHILDILAFESQFIRLKKSQSCWLLRGKTLVEWIFFLVFLIFKQLSWHFVASISVPLDQGQTQQGDWTMSTW